MFHSRWFAVFCFLAGAVLLSRPVVVQAHPSLGSNCAACHGNNQPGNGQVTATGSFAIALRKDGGTNTNALPTFDVVAGSTIPVALTDLVNSNGDNFGVALAGRVIGTTKTSTVPLLSGNPVGALNSNLNTLKFTTDSTWITRSIAAGVSQGIPFPATTYYTLPGDLGSNGDHSPAAGTTYTYNMKIDATTPPDYYALTFATGGGPEDWSSMQEFYIHVLPAAPVPEPGAIVLLGCGAIGLLVWRRGRKT
jgi:hypothetical protein